MRLCFFGRFDPTKGLHVLLRALLSIRNAPLQLDIYGIAQTGAGESYERRLKGHSSGDPRVSFLPPVPSERVVTTLAKYDLLAVPSQCLETGPLVVLEAFAAEVPVLGSRLGGIAELVRDGIDGILVESTSVQAWVDALQKAVTDRSSLSRMKANIRFPRTMSVVVDEMVAVYETSTMRNAPANVV